MRNLGLALLFASLLLAPHIAQAKKKHGKKHGRAPKALKLKALKAKRTARPTPPARDDDVLASAVADTRRAPTPTAAAPAPVIANEPVNMANQVFDDEVPGKKKK
jgi:hypothetical protein